MSGSVDAVNYLRQDKIFLSYSDKDILNIEMF